MRQINWYEIVQNMLKKTEHYINFKSQIPMNNLVKEFYKNLHTLLDIVIWSLSFKNVEKYNNEENYSLK